MRKTLALLFVLICVSLVSAASYSCPQSYWWGNERVLVSQEPKGFSEELSKVGGFQSLVDFFPIPRKGIFMLGSKVVEYESIDTAVSNQVITFEVFEEGPLEVKFHLGCSNCPQVENNSAHVHILGTFEIGMNGKTYKGFVQNKSNYSPPYPLVIDLDADGVIEFKDSQPSEESVCNELRAKGERIRAKKSLIGGLLLVQQSGVFKLGSHNVAYSSIDVTNKRVTLRDLAEGPVTLVFSDCKDCGREVVGTFTWSVMDVKVIGYILNEANYPLKVDVPNVVEEPVQKAEKEVVKEEPIPPAKIDIRQKEPETESQKEDTTEELKARLDALEAENKKFKEKVEAVETQAQEVKQGVEETRTAVQQTQSDLEATKGEVKETRGLVEKIWSWISNWWK